MLYMGRRVNVNRNTEKSVNSKLLGQRGNRDTLRGGGPIQPPALSLAPTLALAQPEL